MTSDQAKALKIGDRYRMPSLDVIWTVTRLLGKGVVSESNNGLKPRTHTRKDLAWATKLKTVKKVVKTV
jgi:hypothetical protein